MKSIDRNILRWTLWATVLSFAACALLSATCGCVADKPIGQAHAANIEVQSGLVAIAAHNDAASRGTRAAIPHADPTGRGILNVVQESHAAVARNVEAASQSARDADAAVTRLGAELDASQARFSKLEARWYVKWGRWIERVFWILALSWLACGALAVFAGMNPIGWLGKVGTFIAHLIPLMNPFTWFGTKLAAK